MYNGKLIFQAVVKFSRCWAQKRRVMLPRASSFQSAHCYQGNKEELRAVRAMTSHLLTSPHKVSVKIFGKILLAIYLPDLVNDGKHGLTKLWWGANQVHVQLNTQFKIGSKRGSARRPWKPSMPQPPTPGAILMFQCPVVETRGCRGMPRWSQDIHRSPGSLNLVLQ